MQLLHDMAMACLYLWVVAITIFAFAILAVAFLDAINNKNK